MKIELNSDQLAFLKSILLSYIKDRKEAAAECEHDEEVSKLFLDRAKQADLLYKAITKQEL